MSAACNIDTGLWQSLIVIATRESLVYRPKIRHKREGYAQCIFIFYCLAECLTIIPGLQNC